MRAASRLLLAGGGGLLCTHNSASALAEQAKSPRRYGLFGPRDDPSEKQKDLDGLAESPFVYEALTRGTRSRVKREAALRDFMRENAAHIQKSIAHLRQQIPKPVAGGESEEDKQMRRDVLNFIAFKEREIQEDVELQTQRIAYGVSTPGDRRQYLENYGCVRWTDKAIKTIADFSQKRPIIEIGAGTGHWEKQLSCAGADILAFDDFSTESPAMHNMVNNPVVGNVQPGNEQKIREHPRRALFLCYPPADDMPLRTLQVYKGKWLFYIGEGRGGVNGTDEFFDVLEKDWVVHEVQEMDPYPQCFERFYILRRKKW